MKPRLQIEDAGTYLVGFGKNKFLALEERRKDLKEPLAEEFYLVDGLTVHIRSSEDHNFIRITGGFSGFLCHPRTGEISLESFNKWTFPVTTEAHNMVMGNGFNPSGEGLPNGPFAYPLIDDDHGTRAVKLADKTWTENKKPPENYGNIDWKGPSGEILSWKGPPSRHFPINPFLEIPGLTQLDFYIESQHGDYSQYTPFSKNVYAKGKIKATAPNVNYPRTDQDVDHGGQVLGAAYLTHNGEKWIVIIVKAIFTVAPAPRNGHFYQVYAAKDGTIESGGWQFVGEKAISHNPSVPFFFNQSGIEAQTVDSGNVWKVAIDANTLTVVFTSTSSTIVAEERSTASTSSTDAAANIRSTMPNVTSVHGMGPTDIHPAWWFPYQDTEAGYNSYIKPLQGKKGEEVTVHNTVQVTKSSERIIAVDYKGDTPVYAKETVSGSENTDYRRVMAPAIGFGGIWGDVRYVDNPSLHILGEISIAEPVSVGSQATIPNGCKGTWSISKGSINPVTGVITDLDCTTGSAAYATITYTSSQGTKTKVVRFAGGYWAWVSETNLSNQVICIGCPGSGLAGYATRISGGDGIKYTVRYGRKNVVNYGCPPTCRALTSPQWFNTDPYPTGCDSSLGGSSCSNPAPSYGSYLCAAGCGECSLTACGTVWDTTECGACYAEYTDYSTYEWRCP